MADNDPITNAAFQMNNERQKMIHNWISTFLII